MAIFNSGAALGAVVAPPLIILLQLRYGWQKTFIVTGALGFIWLVLWLLFYQSPEKHAWITDEELRVIHDSEQQGHGDAETHGHGGAQSREDLTVSPRLSVPASASTRWRDLLGYRQVWAIILARFFTDPIWWLYITWLPKYLADARGFSLTKIALFAWVPYVAADAGSLSGGWLSGHLINRGWGVDRARKTVIAFAALLMPAGILAAFATNPMVALALMGLVLFGFQVWINNVQTMPSDFFSDREVASVAGLGGTGAGIGSMIFIYTTGWVVDHFSYVPILVAAGLLAPIGTIVLFTLSGRIKRLQI